MKTKNSGVNYFKFVTLIADNVVHTKKYLTCLVSNRRKNTKHFWLGTGEKILNMCG